MSNFVNTNSNKCGMTQGQVQALIGDLMKLRVDANKSALKAATTKNGGMEALKMSAQADGFTAAIQAVRDALKVANTPAPAAEPEENFDPFSGEEAAK